MNWIAKLKPRFRLNLLLITVTVFAIACGWLANERNEYRQEQQILSKLPYAAVVSDWFISEN